MIYKTSDQKGNNPSVKNFSLPEQGVETRKKSKSGSEYKKLLQEKQILKELYNLREKQFKKYVKEALAKIKKGSNVADELIKNLESRLDNVVFRLGFAKSRKQARQLVSHCYFLVNGRAVNAPSFSIKKGDIVAIKEGKKKKVIFKDLLTDLKKFQPPNWLDVNKEKLEGKIIAAPSLAQTNPPVEISLVFEFYSR